MLFLSTIKTPLSSVAVLNYTKISKKKNIHIKTNKVLVLSIS